MSRAHPDEGDGGLIYRLTPEATMASEAPPADPPLQWHFKNTTCLRATPRQTQFHTGGQSMRAKGSMVPKDNSVIKTRTAQESGVSLLLSACCPLPQSGFFSLSFSLVHQSIPHRLLVPSLPILSIYGFSSCLLLTSMLL